MTTTNCAVDEIVRHIGFDPPRAKAVARALTDAGVLPSGAPGKSPILDPRHLVDIVLGCAVDAPLRAVADAVVRYRALTPGGANLTGAPGSIDTAGRALDIFADIAIHGEYPNILRRDAIDVVSNWPEISLHQDGATMRFVASDALASHWQFAGHRKSATINCAAFVDTLRELFAGEKEWRS